MSSHSSRGPSVRKLEGRDVPAEFDDTKYFREVLQLEDGLTDKIYEENLIEEARFLGIKPIALDPNVDQLHLTSSQDSKTSIVSSHSRTFSLTSHNSSSTDLTGSLSNKPSDIFTESLLMKENNPRINIVSTREGRSIDIKSRQEVKLGLLSSLPDHLSSSLIHVPPRKISFKFRKLLRTRFQRTRRNRTSIDLTHSCVRCQEVLKGSSARLTLACNHSLCDNCTQFLVLQSCNDEVGKFSQLSKNDMSGSVIDAILSKEERLNFLNSVLKLSSPSDLRKLCPFPACSHQPPTPKKMDKRLSVEYNINHLEGKNQSISPKMKTAQAQNPAPKNRTSRESVNYSYKRSATVELNQSKLGHSNVNHDEQQRKLVDDEVGCPNASKDDETKIKRGKAKRETTLDTIIAQNQIMGNCELSALHARQINERDRFRAFERKMKWFMLSRQRQQRVQILERYELQFNKMRERHIKTAVQLEDSQVAAEMELRTSLSQTEQSVRIRLRHMEAYCSTIGQKQSSTIGTPSRVVTERDLRELGQQYNIQDNISQLHQSKINILREKQAKRMEQLLARQEDDLVKLDNKLNEEIKNTEKRFSAELQGLTELFDVRRANLQRKLDLEERIERKKLELKDNTVFLPLPPIEWPEQESDTEQEIENTGGGEFLKPITE